MPDRITLSRVKGFRRPEGTIQVDRATVLGNPWQVGDPGVWWMPDSAGGNRWETTFHFGFPIDQGAAVDFFATWIRSGNLPLMPDNLTQRGRAVLRESMALRRNLILSRLPALRGHPLGCRCKPGTPCHADVLLEIANA